MNEYVAVEDQLL